MYDEKQLRPLSLNARLAIGLHCFSRFCSQKNLDDPRVDEFVNHLWGWLNVNYINFEAWESHDVALIDVALGEPLNESLQTKVRESGISVTDFQSLLEHVVEIIYGSFYAAGDDKQSMEDLKAVLDYAVRNNVKIPDTSVFANSKFKDKDGWGNHLTLDEIKAWMNAK